jgi:hypothetical protein
MRISVRRYSVRGRHMFGTDRCKDFTRITKVYERVDSVVVCSEEL